METQEPALRSLLAWWEEAGVESLEAAAILAAPAVQPKEALRQPAAPPPPPRKRVAAPTVNVVDDARAAAAEARTLHELGEALRAFDGCGLKKTARNTVFLDGVEGAPLLVVGEAPGQEEDAAGKPFVGRSGQLLDRMLASIGFTRRANVLITNVIYWRPPGNRPPTQVEVAACLPFLERTLALAAPKLVILSGGFAAQTVLKRDEGVMRLRGKRLNCPAAGLTQPLHAMVMLHPAYLLRRPHDKRLAWSDLLALQAWADEIGIERVQVR